MKSLNVLGRFPNARAVTAKLFFGQNISFHQGRKRQNCQVKKLSIQCLIRKRWSSCLEHLFQTEITGELHSISQGCGQICLILYPNLRKQKLESCILSLIKTRSSSQSRRCISLILSVQLKQQTCSKLNQLENLRNISDWKQVVCRAGAALGKQTSLCAETQGCFAVSHHPLETILL